MRLLALLIAPKNGFFYVPDRLSGELLSANHYVKVNWATHIDLETGRPVLNPEGMYWKAPPGTSVSGDPSAVERHRDRRRALCQGHAGPRAQCGGIGGDPRLRHRPGP